MGAAASLNPTTPSVEPGSVATVEVRIRNNGTVVDQFTLDVVGDPSAWTSIAPPTLSLLPGSEGTATVSFHPPRSSEIRAGSFPFGIRVASKEDPAGSVTEEGTLEVGAFKELFGELIPRTSRGRAEGRHELAIDNRGNLGVNADLEAVDPNAALRFRFSPPSLVTEPNSASFVRLGVRPAKRFLKGPPKSHTFQVTVKPQAAPPLVLDGAMLQEAILPPWIMKAIAAVIALLLLALLAWLTLLKPAIKTAAKQAVAAPLAAQSAKTAQVAAAQAQQAKAIESLTGSPLPSPSISPTGAVGATAAGDPFHQRLPISATFPAGQTKTDNYTVGAKNTLSVSDILLENPQGDSGTLGIEVVDPANPTPNVLITENMDNFRDLDYHFVSPPVLTANQKLQIRVNCAASNGSQATPPAPNRPCTPSVFFSGFLKQGS